MPVEIQARIAAIQSRFSAASTTTTATPTRSNEFTAALASMTEGTSNALFGTGEVDGSMASLLGGAGGLGGTSGLGALYGTGGLSSSQQQLVASALASRNAAFGVSGVGSVGNTGAFPAAAAPQRIASKATVEGIEKTLSNGKLRNDQLAPIGVGSHKLHPEASAAFKQLQAAAKADGIDFGVTDSYRSYDAQVDVARRKGLYSQGGLAAKPGTSSHGYGLAVDLDLDSKALNWMRNNAGRFGFVEDTPRETWHWKFDGI